jgi:hypothetical protein
VEHVTGMPQRVVVRHDQMLATPEQAVAMVERFLAVAAQPAA